MHINRTKFVSPNCAERTDAVDTVIIHSTHMSAMPALERLCDQRASVSCHYLIDLEGAIYQLVPEEKSAWHAGVSCWRGRTHLNKYSIGIELVDRSDNGDEIQRFPQKQIDMLVPLLHDIIKRHGISQSMVLAHSDIAPDRKDDPGEHFPWDYLAKHNIGVYPKFNNKILERFNIHFGDNGDRVSMVQEWLSKYGYKINCDGHFGKEMSDVVRAFKRHFDQRNIGDNFDEVSLDILCNILSKI